MSELDPASGNPFPHKPSFPGKMAPMKLALAAAGLVVIAVASAFAVQRFDRTEQFRVLMAAGDRALAAGDSYGAIESYSGAMALRANSMVSYLRRGKAYAAQRRQDEAVRDYLEALRLQPGAADPLLALAELYDGQADAAHAAEWYARAANVDPQNPTLLYRLALNRYRAGQASTAIDPLRRAVALDAGFDEAHYLLGVVLRDTQDVAAATDSLERAIRANPKLTAARDELADLYRAQGRFVDEMTQLTELAATDPGTPRTVALALAEARQGQYDAALSGLRAARDRDPADSLITLAVGRVHLMRAESTTDPVPRMAAAQLALPPLERALGGSVRRSEGLMLYGRALYLAGDIEGAERLLRAAVATSPLERMAFAYLADAAENLGHYTDARNWLARFDALEGDTAAAPVRASRARRLGGLALAAGDPAGALDYLDVAGQLGLRDVTMLGWLADARWQTGDAPGARTALAEALTLAPNDPALMRLRRRIR